jgi:hypothetical protein
MDELSVLFGIVSILAVVFYIVFFVWVGKNDPTGSSTHNWNDIKSDIFSSWVCPIVAIVFTFFASAYFVQYPNYALYIAMGLSCLAVGTALASLSFAMVSR